MICSTKAVYHCYALVFGETTYKPRADGEVGSPGQVLLSEVMERSNLGSHVFMVSRIYGGTKLGPAGVARAFREAGAGAVTEYLKTRKML